MKRLLFLLRGSLLVGWLLLSVTSQAQTGRWSAEKANDWYAKQGWLVGCNFIPSTAINELEMWQADTFDPTTIDRELGFAEGLGMNKVLLAPTPTTSGCWCGTCSTSRAIRVIWGKRQDQHDL